MANQPGWQVLHHRMSPRDYATCASSFKYIAAPRGNGLDTHRFWEALYRGSLPVVIKSKWSQQIASLGIPVVEVEDWQPETLHAVLAEDRVAPDPYAIPALWSPYWENVLQES